MINIHFLYIRISKTKKVGFRDILYFDDDSHDFKDALSLTRSGTVVVLVKRNKGISLRNLKDGLIKFSKMRMVENPNFDDDFISKEMKSETDISV